MSTRAVVGFLYNDELKCMYNHCDGYPSYLGCNIKEELRNYNCDYMREKFNKIKIIDNSESLIPINILNKLLEKNYIHNNFSYNEKITWYSALREHQGEIEPFMEWEDEYNYMLNGKPYCDGTYEYGYFIDLNESNYITKSFVYKEDQILLKEPFKYNQFINDLNKNRMALIINLNKLNNISNKEYLKIFDEIENS